MTPTEASEICERCGGNCCKFELSKKVLPHDTYNREYWEMRRTDKIETPEGTIYLHNQRCPKLDDDGRCSVYDKRPQLCRDFPFKGVLNDWRLVCELYRYYLEHPDEWPKGGLRSRMKFRL